MNTQNIPNDYPTNLCNEEWKYIMPYLPVPSPIGRPPTYEWRDILNGINYVLTNGEEWGLVQKLNDELSVEIRLQQGREPLPSAAAIDSQTIKSTPTIDNQKRK